MIDIGKHGLEEARQARFEKMRQQERQQEREFQTSERLAKEEFQRGERTAREAFQMKQAQAKGGPGADEAMSPKLDKDPDTGKVIGIITPYKSGKTTYTDLTKDTVTELGKGQLDIGVDEATNTEAEAYAADKVDAIAGTWSTDSTDFKDFQGSRELAQRAFKQEYIDAAKEGTLGDLLGGTTEQKPPASIAKPAQEPASSKVDRALQFYKDQASEEDILKAILNDPKFSDADKEDARNRLGGSTTPPPARAEKQAPVSDEPDYSTWASPPQSVMEASGLAGAGRAISKGIGAATRGISAWDLKQKAKEAFAKQHARLPTDEELAEFMRTQG
jgi:hypothetical protein